ncbi:MAG: hypothetical protein U0790_05895 [Isosphaeraceae bacterium]
MTVSSPEKPGGDPAGSVEPARPSSVLIVWVLLLLALNAIRWLGGFPAGNLAQGIEEGVARAEIQARGESTEEQIRKIIRSQRETVSFWTALAALDDFLIEPAVLAGRAVVVATLFAGVAALSGRPIRYELALLESARIQGIWVLGLALRVALLVGLRRAEHDVDTSLALLLGPGSHPAVSWMVLRQLDLFALIGWGALGVAGWRRGDASLAAATTLCAGLCLVEIGVRTGIGLLLGGAIRLSLMVQ